MRKILTAVAVCLLCYSATFAQKMKGKTFLGFTAGCNLSTFRTAVDYTDFDQRIRAGFSLGAFVEIPVSSRFKIQPEFLYSQMGANAKVVGDEYRFKYNYFSVPLIVKYKIAKQISILAGPQADFLFRARVKDFAKTQSVTYKLKHDYDLGFTAGAEAELSKKFSAMARYIHGIRDVSPTVDENTFYNQGFQLSIGYKLHAKPKKTKTKKTK